MPSRLMTSDGKQAGDTIGGFDDNGILCKSEVITDICPWDNDLKDFKFSIDMPQDGGIKIFTLNQLVTWNSISKQPEGSESAFYYWVKLINYGGNLALYNKSWSLSDITVPTSVVSVNILIRRVTLV